MQWHGLATAASHRKFLAAEGLLGVNPAPLHIKPDLSHQYPSQKSELIHKSGLGTGMELGYDASLCCLPCPLLTQKAHSCPIPPLSTTPTLPSPVLYLHGLAGVSMVVGACGSIFMVLLWQSETVDRAFFQCSMHLKRSGL